jgi:hypothetical protein
MAFIPSKPMHNTFIFRDLNSTQYKTYAKNYSRAKAGGIRGIYAWATGAGVAGIAKDLAKGVVINYGKRKAATVCIGAMAYISGPVMVVFTNASQIVNISKSIHNTAAYCFECVEDSTNLAFLPFDLAFFGQPIPVGADTDFLDS